MSDASIFPPDFDFLDTVLRERTIAKLRWQYGDERAELITAGQDPRTNLDLAKWRALGAPLPRHPRQRRA
jgi:hypothetical protein